MSHESNAILAINSLDRYITSSTVASRGLALSWLVATPNILTLQPISVGTAIIGSTLVYTPGLAGWPNQNPVITNVVGNQVTINQNVTANSSGIKFVNQLSTVSYQANQPVSNSLLAQYQNSDPPCYNFTIQSPGALIYGYIDRIIVSQIQLQYNIPTVISNKNDTFYINQSPVVIPYGFYSPDELATVLQVQIRAGTNVVDCLVTFDPQDGFLFTTAAFSISFTNALAVPTEDRDKVLKTYRLLGITKDNIPSNSVQFSRDYPNFLYTPYIDIYSDVLTNYQNVKDTNTTVGKFKGMVARVYLSGTGNVQLTTADTALGSSPFVMTADLNNGKVIKWSPDVAVPSIDFQLYDQYNEFIPGAEDGFSTEFQITLLCIEGER